MKALVLPLLIVPLALTPSAPAATCAPVRDPYPGTRYEGADITGIRTTDVGCERGRRVARRAHRKGLGVPPPPSGVRRYRWRGWDVTGDLRPPKDRYVARKGRRVVRWRF